MSENKIKVDVDKVANTITVKEDKRVVVANSKISYGFRRKLENLRSPKKIRAKRGSEEFTMEMDDYDYKKDPDLCMLAKQLKGWSKDEEVSDYKTNLDNIADDTDNGDLFDAVIKKLREENNMSLASEEEEKNE